LYKDAREAYHNALAADPIDLAAGEGPSSVAVADLESAAAGTRAVAIARADRGVAGKLERDRTIPHQHADGIITLVGCNDIGVAVTGGHCRGSPPPAPPVQELQREIGQTTELADFVNVHDIGMLEPCRRSRLALGDGHGSFQAGPSLASTV
jgi:hypothetical protein